ncbi:MAG: hypothetical protein ACYC4S_06925 [Rhodoferax sp.]
MKHTIEIDCPPEILIGLHLDAKKFADLIKLQSATTLFREGKLLSGMASRWCGAGNRHFGCFGQSPFSKLNKVIRTLLTKGLSEPTVANNPSSRLQKYQLIL